MNSQARGHLGHAELSDPGEVRDPAPHGSGDEVQDELRHRGGLVGLWIARSERVAPVGVVTVCVFRGMDQRVQRAVRLGAHPPAEKLSRPLDGAPARELDPPAALVVVFVRGLDQADHAGGDEVLAAGGRAGLRKDGEHLTLDPRDVRVRDLAAILHGSSPRTGHHCSTGTRSPGDSRPQPSSIALGSAGIGPAPIRNRRSSSGASGASTA